MPSLPEPRISLTREDVCRAWGERRTRLAAGRVPAAVTEILGRMHDERWLQPASSHGIREIAGSSSGWLELNDGTRLESPLIAHRLHRATLLAAGVCTVGGELRRRVNGWFAAGEPLKAVLLDEIGSLALHRLGDCLEQLIRAEARRMGLDASGVLNPGEPGFDLSEQRKVTELAGGAGIGVSLTAAGMLSPEKSLTLVMGLGKRIPHWHRSENCAHCGARRRCPYRHKALEGLAA